jgi:serine protease Do
MAAAAAAALAGCGGEAKPKEMTAEQLFDFAREAVVRIEVSSTKPSTTASPENALCASAAKPPNGQMPYLGGSGTGFVIDTDGYIVTNAHVVAPCPESWPDMTVQVIVGKAAPLTAKVVGVDQLGDIAVLKVDHEFDKALEFGDSEDVKPGQEVVALGFPGHLEGEITLTRGVVSVASRAYQFQGDLVQTDAAINHGNSGGPLLNARGQVIGVNELMYLEETGPDTHERYEAINFAISARMTKRLVRALRKDGEVRRADLLLNVEDVQFVTQSDATRQYSINNPVRMGMLITNVGDASPLSGKVRPCDVVDEINAEPIRVVGDYIEAMTVAEPGKEMSIKLRRYPEDKCKPIPPCAFKTRMESWGTGCPLDPLANIDHSPLSGLTSPDKTYTSPFTSRNPNVDAYFDTSTLSDLYQERRAKAQEKQDAFDAEARRILASYKEEGATLTVKVTPR